MFHPIFEVCAANIQSVLAAERAGAQRIELCSALDTGGLTPSIGLIQAAARVVRIPVYVLIRPREGDFCYAASEMALMLADIRACRDAGAQGVVIGALQADGQLQINQLSELREAAGDLGVTCHRAFDFTPDPFAALDQLASLGIQRVLTSGQAETAYAGRFLLQKLVAHAAGRLVVMPGAGITATNIRKIAEVSGAREFHFTGKKKVGPTLATGLPGLENGYWQSAEAIIKEIILTVANVGLGEQPIDGPGGG